MPERVTVLYDRLRQLEATLAHEMRARGFDPDQLETTALPASLAALALERDEIKSELEELKGEVRETTEE